MEPHRHTLPVGGQDAEARSPYWPRPGEERAALVRSGGRRGEEAAQTIQLYMQYAPEPPFDAGTPETAPSGVVSTARKNAQAITEQRREIDRLREDLRRSEAERQRLRRENDKLKEDLEAARRAVYRQAAPFSRGTRVVAPKRPGRKAGAAYGRHAHRSTPSQVDVIEAYRV